MTDEAREAAFEAWAAGVIYNDQPLPDRKGIPYFLAQKAHAAGVVEGIRQAREAVASKPQTPWFKQDALDVIDDLTT